VTVVLRNRGQRIRALKWLVLDATAPLLGVASTYFYSLSEARLGLVLALFCGFFLYIGAADLLPESHHRHPKRLTAVLNVVGATLIWATIHLAAI
jgi:ZIP family zinc transporter